MKTRSKHRTPRTEARMRIVVDVLRSYGEAAFPKQKTLARRCHMTLGTLIRMLDELKRDGLLKTELRGPTSCLYSLTFKPEMARVMAKALARPLARARRVYPCMNKGLSEEEQRPFPPNPVEKPTPELETVAQVDTFAAEHGLPVGTGEEFFHAELLMLGHKVAQSETAGPWLVRKAGA